MSKTKEGIRYHEHDFLGTTLWSMDTKGNRVKDYQDTTIFGEGSIQKDRSARFTGKPYDEDLQAYVFPYRNYDASTARWRTSDPAGYPDGINQHFYVCNPTTNIDVYGLDLILVGQGGKAYGSLFTMAAETYARNNGQNNQIVHVNNGAETINAINNYAANNGGKVDSLQIFAHSGSQAIWFDMGESTQSSDCSFGLAAANIAIADPPCFPPVKICPFGLEALALPRRRFLVRITTAAQPQTSPIARLRYSYFPHFPCIKQEAAGSAASLRIPSEFRNKTRNRSGASPHSRLRIRGQRM